MKLSYKQTEFKPYTGCILLSEPFLLDPNFRRTAVLLTEFNNLGAIGFILNRLLSFTTNELFPQILDFNFPVFYGGPVELNTLHFIHKNNQHIEGAIKVNEMLYWSGNLEEVNQILLKNPEERHNFKFFMGYSGWSPLQLENEMEIKSWWVTHAKNETIFTDDLEDMWKNLVKTLGKDFAHLANPPKDYLFN